MTLAIIAAAVLVLWFGVRIIRRRRASSTTEQHVSQRWIDDHHGH